MATILKNIPEPEYNKIPALRSSIITTIHKRTLAHAKAQIDGLMEQTEAMKFGSATHDYILRPQVFAEKWGILPEGCKLNTKEGKEAKALLEPLHGDNILKADELAEIKQLSAGLLNNTFSKVLLANIVDTELTLVWKEDGIDCKARIDAVARIGDKTLIIDLKTAKSAELSDFERATVNYGYHIQSAHYLAGAKACGLIPNNSNDFIHIVVEKEPPYLTANYCIDDGSLDLGYQQRYQAMKKYSFALETGNWTGYPSEIQPVALPHWYIQAQETENFNNLGA